MDNLKALAIDTSTELLSIAVMNGTERVWTHEEAGGAKSSAALLPAIHLLLEKAQLELAQLDAVIYGCGPGSFTGLRTTCAVAQGLVAAIEWGAVKKKIQAVPVNSLMATAEHAREQTGVQKVLVALDARMNEVYACAYVWNGASWHSVGAMDAISPTNLQLAQGFSLVGNAHLAYPEALMHLAEKAIFALPKAQAMLSLAPQLLANGCGGSAQEITPLYIRNKVALTTQEREALKQQRNEGESIGGAVGV